MKNYKPEMLVMMERCRCEIRDLRDRLAVVEPKAEAYDKLSIVLGLIPSRDTRGYSEDLLWTLNKRIDELSAPATEEAEEADNPAVPA